MISGLRHWVFTAERPAFGEVCTLPDSFVALLSERSTQIMPAEMVASILPTLLHPTLFSGKAATSFIDIVGALRSQPVSCSVGCSGSGVRCFVVLGICGTWVGSSVCLTTLIVANRFKGAGCQKCLMLCGNVTFRLRERWRNPCVTTWYMINHLMTTDARRWNVVGGHGEMGDMFFQFFTQRSRTTGTLGFRLN